MKKILLHICCGPCAISVVEKLRAEDFEVTGFYYNPNIQPKKEFQKRLKAVRQLAKIINLPIMVAKYEAEEHLVANENLENPERCFACYKLRLEKTAQIAAAKNYKYFTTTLLVSPYQNLDKVRQIGGELAQKYHLEFIDRDFVSQFRQGHQKAHDLGLYCQKYCGCFYSLKNKS